MQTEVSLLFSKLQSFCSAIISLLSSLKANQSSLCVEDLLSGLTRKFCFFFFFESVVEFCSRQIYIYI